MKTKREKQLEIALLKEKIENLSGKKVVFKEGYETVTEEPPVKIKPVVKPSEPVTTPKRTPSISPFKPGIQTNPKPKALKVMKEDEEDGLDDKETGLNLIPRSQNDIREIKEVLDGSEFYYEYDEENKLFFLPEDEIHYDELESELEDLFSQFDITYRIEGI